MARGRTKKAVDEDEVNADGSATTGYEAELWRMADSLRGSMDAAEYKHVVLGLIFLKCISDAFEERHAAVLADWGADAAKDRDENIFWAHLKNTARQPAIGRIADDTKVIAENIVWEDGANSPACG